MMMIHEIYKPKLQRALHQGAFWQAVNHVNVALEWITERN